VSGPNGAGKTNLLEALHVGTQGFSPRARNDAQLIRFDCSASRVELSGDHAGRAFAVDLTLSAADGRRVVFNGGELRSTEQLRHELWTLVFTPDRLAVVKGGPATRRAYLDRTCGRLYPGRAILAAEYASAVGQRNAALRRVVHGTSSRDALTPWTQAVVDAGSALVETRRSALELLRPVFADRAAHLGLAGAWLDYEGEPLTVDELERRLERDLERGVTGAGPHLHDVRIRAGDRDLRTYGSQGEQRSAVLALVLAEAEALSVRTGSTPLVLLDDVLSELDETRRRALAELVSGFEQTVVTTTSPAMLPMSPTQSLIVSPGHVARG
jgi:DNA replication and repair protein RecF